MSILIPLDRIDDNPWQTRQRYDDAYIDELAGDIERNGLLQVPVGRLVSGDGPSIDGQSGDGQPISEGDVFLQSQSDVEGALKRDPALRVELAFGMNRLRATRKLSADNGITDDSSSISQATLPVTLRPLTDEQMADHAWSENAKRKDITPIEEALALQKRMDDFKWSQKQVAEHTGQKRATVANKLRLLKLPPEMQEAVGAGTVSVRVAQALLPLYTAQEPLKTALRSYQLAYRNTPEYDYLIEDVMDGDTSESIRRSVTSLFFAVTQALGVIDPAYDYGAEGVVAMRQGDCIKCPLLITIDKKKRCGDAACYQEKHTRAAGIVLGAASEETGLPITNFYDDQKATTFSRYYSSEKALARRLAKKGCPSNRLHIRLDRGRSGTTLKGHDQVELVCVHAAGGRCKCRGTSKSGTSSAATAAAAQETRIGRAQAKLLGEERYAAPAKEVLYSALLNQNTQAWNIALGIVRKGPNTSGSWGHLSAFLTPEPSMNHGGDGASDTLFEEGDQSTDDESSTFTFEAFCRHLADWVMSIEVHHFGDRADSLEKVKQFADKRMKAMGLTYEEPDYGAINIHRVLDLATLSIKEATFKKALEKANRDTVEDTIRRITDEDGKPRQGHKSRLKALQGRLQDTEVVHA